MRTSSTDPAADAGNSGSETLSAPDLADPALRPGVVVRVDRATAVVDHGYGDHGAGDHDDHGAGGAVRATWGPAVLAAIGRDAEAAPTTGDHVVVRHWPDGRATVETVHPRRSLLTRADADGGSARQVLAANVDVVAVVEGLVPDPDLRRIARLLALAWSSGAEPVVLLTKADLAPDADELATTLRRTSSCPVVPVSVVTGEGVVEVRDLLAGGRVLALLGASGAGKSSLLNTLAGTELMRVQQLRRDGKGRHTTVTRELHPLAGGYVIDGPGLRGVGVTGGDGLDLTFADVLAHADGCRFRDCRHAGEPGCAVAAAVEAGDLDADRVDGWHQLVAEGRRQEVRRDARLQAEERRKRRVLHRAARQAYRQDPHRT